MPNYVVIREVDGGACFLCATPRETSVSAPDMYWEVLELPLSGKTDVMVFSSEIEAWRVKAAASNLEVPFSISHGSCRIAPWETVSSDLVPVKPMTETEFAARRDLTCCSFDRFPPDVQIYAALQVLIAEIIRTCQYVGESKFVGGRFDRNLIEHCEGALRAYRESLRESPGEKNYHKISQEVDR
jgi:hypothetical protein